MQECTGIGGADDGAACNYLAVLGGMHSLVALTIVLFVWCCLGQIKVQKSNISDTSTWWQVGAVADLHQLWPL